MMIELNSESRSLLVKSNKYIKKYGEDEGVKNSDPEELGSEFNNILSSVNEQKINKIEDLGLNPKDVSQASNSSVQVPISSFKLQLDRKIKLVAFVEQNKNSIQSPTEVFMKLSSKNEANIIDKDSAEETSFSIENPLSFDKNKVAVNDLPVVVAKNLNLIQSMAESKIIFNDVKNPYELKKYTDDLSNRSQKLIHGAESSVWLVKQSDELNSYISATPNSPDTSSAEFTEAATKNIASYWISQGLQNVELKVGGLGKTGLEITVAVKGDEALIDFRTNESDVRQLLTGSSAVLTDSLANEGLVLVDVSIGASGHEKSGQSSKERDQTEVISFRTNRRGDLQNGIVETLCLPQSSLVNTGRAVDLFV